MSLYLKNDICDFEPLFEIDYRKKQNILSASFFKLEEKGYKDFNKYLEGIKFIDKKIYILKNFRLRLFIERSVYKDEKLMSVLNNLKNTDLVVYHSKIFSYKKDYHQDLFGTFVRLFPFFNFPNNDANIVKTSDIDFGEELIKKIFREDQKFIEKIKTKNIIFGYECYRFFHKYMFKNHKKDWKYNIRDNGYVLPYIDVGIHTFNFNRINKEILYNFMKERKKYTKEIKEITSYFDHKKSNLKSFIYGLNPYLINVIIPKYLIDYKKPFIFTFRYNILENLYSYIIIGNKRNKEYEKFFKTILKDDDNFEFQNIKKSYNYLDSMIYPYLYKKNPPKKVYDLIFNIYKYYIQNYEKKAIDNYDKNFVSLLISEQFLGIYSVKNILSGYNIKNLKNKLFGPNKLDKNLIEELQLLKGKLKINLKLPNGNITL